MVCKSIRFSYLSGMLLPMLCALVIAGCWTSGPDETLPSGPTHVGEPAPRQEPTLSSHVAHTNELAPVGETTPSESTGQGDYIISSKMHVPAPLRLKIFESTAIVRATLVSSAAVTERYSAADGTGVDRDKESIEDWWPQDGEYRASHRFRFRVAEYLKGSGASEITVTARTLGTFGTEALALKAATDSLGERDTSRDAHEAVLFLWESTSSAEFRFLRSGPYPSLHYTIDTLNRVWLPANNPPTSGGGSSSPDDSFPLYLAEEPLGTAMSTMSLGELRSEIATVDALIEEGDGTDEYRECLVEGWRYEQTYPEPRVPPETVYQLASGTPEITALKLSGHYGSGYNRTLIQGRDKDLFKAVLIDDDDLSDNGYRIGEATARPLPTGMYQYNRYTQRYQFIPCNFIPYYSNRIRNVTVTAPAGTLHELFFDPVTVGSAVSADATNGVLKPTSFTDANGAPATIESISYESDTVRVKVVPWSELSGQILDFIELDGRVSLSLSVANSTVHTADDVFVWSVGPQPWKDGDKLMVRIRPGIATFASPPARVTAAVSGGNSVNLSWDAGRGAAGYQVQRRENGVETWEMEDDSVTERSYVVSGLSCKTSYDFRVGAYGDGRRYETEVRSWSAPVSETTGACTQPPVFDAASYSFEVSEDAVAGTQVGTVSATDPDAGDTLTYSVVSGNEAGKFAIDGSAGVITLVGTLDYESASSYTLTVEASDGKGGTAMATVTIGVVNVADTGAPVFGASAYAFSVIEGASVGSAVGAVSATDPNEGDTVAYSISAGNDAGKFAIDGSTGRITLAGTLDYQTASSHTLTVNASDGKGGKGTAGVTVSVEQASCSNGTAVASPSDNAGLVADCLTLLALRDSLEGTVVLNWSSDVAIGNWKGVGVAGTPGRVQSLSLSDLGLNGTVPSALAKLSGLELLELSENNLTGAIPTELGDLTRLGRLSLGQNRLTGSIPPSLGRLSNLYSLAVADNALSGSIPSTLGSLSRLLYLSLGGNDLSGTVPSELGSLASLQYLYLDTNDLTGGIPTQLGSLAKLEILSLYGNKLTGGIPSELGNLSKLEELMLSRNSLTGSIPTSLERLSKLVYLRLSGNRLTGCIPTGLRNVADSDLGSMGLAYCASEA